MLHTFSRAISLFSVRLVFLLSLTVIAAAQDTVTGGFQGDVSDSRTGVPIPGAAVSITSERTGAVYNLTTDSKGIFFQGLLAEGFYEIQISVPGYRTQSLRREIRITATGDIVPVPVSMEPDTSPSPPTPVLDQPDNIRVVMNAVDARGSASRKDGELAAMPIGGATVTRSFDELALLVPGVAPPPQTIGDVAGPGVGPGVGSAGQFSVNGLRSRGNNFTVDGSDNNDEDIGVRRQGFVAFIPQPLESIGEFSIITLLAPAKFGRNIGAQVNAVSKAGGNKIEGSIYGFFNSKHLNSRNQFDSTNGSAVSSLRTLGGLPVLLDGTAISVRNQSGDEEPFSFGQAGGTLGGALRPNRTFYFVSGEFQKINARREKNFAVPTVEERGVFKTGTTGIATNFFTGTTLPSPLYPVALLSNRVFSLFPFANDPNGVYGANTFTQSLDASGRGTILSGRLDQELSAAGSGQRLSGRYNFTDDKKAIPAVNEAIFSNIRSRIRTHNISVVLNSDLNSDRSSGTLFNQARFSFGHTRLDFNEIRDQEFLIPSDDLPNEPFLLNARAIFNVTLPQFGGQARYTRIAPGFGTVPETVENALGPIGQVMVAGFSPLGVDVYNFPQDRTNRTYQFADELTKRAGEHSLVFGADIRLTTLDSDLPRLARSLLTLNGAPRLVNSSGTCPNGGIGNFCFLPVSDPRAVIRPEDLLAFGGASNFLQTFNLDRPDSRVKLNYYQLNFYAQDTWRARRDLSLSFGLRYEYNSPIKSADDAIEASFSDGRLATVPVLRDLVAGRKTLYSPDKNNIAPRVGIAYSADLFGSSRISIFRAGYGLYYDQILGAVANQSRNVFPTYLTLNLGAVRLPGFGISLDNPSITRVNGVRIRTPGTVNRFNSGGFAASGTTFADFIQTLSGGPGGLFANAINVTLPSERLQTPMAHHYSIIFEQQLSRHYAISLGYVGTTGRDLLRFTTPNLGASLTVSPTSMQSASFAPLPTARGVLFVPDRPLDRSTGGDIDSLGAINQFETTAPSQYHSLQTQLRSRFFEKLNFQLSYTFSKATDEVSDVFDLAGAFVLPQDSFDLAAESGPANFDVRHRVTYDLIYTVPTKKNGAFARRLANGLQIATTGRLTSGQPFTVNSTIDINLDGNTTDRLNTLSGLEISSSRSQPLRLTTANSMSLLAPFGQNGQIRRNSFTAGNIVELDASIIKRFTFGPHRLSVRTDIFNFLNRTNYGIPVRILEAPGFGKAVNTVTPGRRVQFLVKYEF